MNALKSNNQASWNGNPILETLFILLPPFFCLGVIILFPNLFQNNEKLPDYWWVILILLIDVAHVYSTLYRTYFDKVAIQKHGNVLFSIPFFAFIVSVIIYSTNNIWFWRILAYVAVFHFIRQQYGFVRLYSRKEKVEPIYKSIDTIMVYTSTIFPIIYWHLNAPRNFNWFVNGDFIYFKSTVLLTIAYCMYILILAIYIVKEVVLFSKIRVINFPRILIIVGTIISWYFGIVYFNGDLAFTFLNVVSHGIPYMALIWIYGNKSYKNSSKSSFVLQLVFKKYGFVFFLIIIFILAFIEEGLWDAFVWKEHANIFPFFKSISFTLNNKVLNFLVPLLALPQITHYIIDGFIWKINQDKFEWSKKTII